MHNKNLNNLLKIIKDLIINRILKISFCEPYTLKK